MPTSYLKIAPSYPPSLPPQAYIKERQQQPPSTPKIMYTLFLPVTYKGDDISASKMARELILGSNWGRIQFPIQWCRLHVWYPHQFRTLTVERSPLTALVKKLAFLVSIGWQPIVGGGGGGTMGHFRESSYAHLLFENCTILSTITSITCIPKGKATTASINTKNNIYVIFACYIQKGWYFRF